ncbi:MAG: hypothetical protein LBN95_08380 [Prevotellaceae bacterium]|jgi:hypothetical protein|nr:hypothetical protein [Prevotellaceae bacterium]
MKHSFLLLIFYISCLSVFGQDNQIYLQRANTFFEAGDYDKAKRHYEAYIATGGKQDVSQRIADSEKCLQLRITADNYFNEKEYVKAAEKYYALLALNPKDQHANNRQTEIKNIAGVKYYDNGYYVGNFNEKSERHGQGIYYWNDGSRYDGQWKNGNKHGQGNYYDNKGNRYEGQWQNDVVIGNFLIYFTDGTIVSAKYVNKEWVIIKAKKKGKEYDKIKKEIQTNKSAATTKVKSEKVKKDNDKPSMGFVSYSFSLTAPIGIMAGGCGNRLGGYGSLKASSNFWDGTNVSNIEGAEAIIDFDSPKHYRYAVSAGLILRTFGSLYIYGGLGFGKYGKVYYLGNSYDSYQNKYFELSYETNKSYYYAPKISAGLDISAGLIYAFKRDYNKVGVYLSAGYNTLQLIPDKVHDFSIGLGVVF